MVSPSTQVWLPKLRPWATDGLTLLHSSIWDVGSWLFLPVFLSFFCLVCIPVYLFASLSLNLFVQLSSYVSVSVTPPACLSVCLSAADASWWQTPSYQQPFWVRHFLSFLGQKTQSAQIDRDRETDRQTDRRDRDRGERLERGWREWGKWVIFHPSLLASRSAAFGSLAFLFLLLKIFTVDLNPSS